jgi:hypothetical protein
MQAWGAKYVSVQMFAGDRGQLNYGLMHFGQLNLYKVPANLIMVDLCLLLLQGHLTCSIIDTQC